MAHTKAGGISEHLIDELIDDLRPVAPVRAASVYSVALVLQTLFVALAAAFMGVGVTVVDRFVDGFFPLLVSVLVFAAGASAWLAARMSIPGRHVDGAAKALVPALPLGLAVLVVVFSPWGADLSHLQEYLALGMPCTRMLAAIALPAWLVALVLLRMLAPLDTLSIGLFAALSALAQAAVVMQLACPAGDAYHLAVGHYLPITLIAALAAIASSVLLKMGVSRR